MKIALAMIVKPTDAEALVLDRCLCSVMGAVDAMYITQAGTKKNKKVTEVIEAHGGHESFFRWTDNFSEARNYNFSQVPKEYDYIFWLDADDIVRGADKLKETVKQNQLIDVFSLWYLYAFDEWRNPIVVHHKSRVIRNDGCVQWVGEVHEDFKENRKVTIKHIDGVEVLHLTNDDRIEDSKKRNVQIAKKQKEAHPDDPRSLWNTGNAFKAQGKHEKALKEFEKFLELSLSDDEKYIVRIRRAESLYILDKKKDAIEELRYAVGLKPDYPDAYILLGQYYYDTQDYQNAISVLKQGLVLEPPIYKIIVYNPRDYDYTPLKWLGYSYVAVEQPILALECFKAMLEITPRDEQLKNIVNLMEQKAEQQEEMLELYAKIKEMDLISMKQALDDLPYEFKAHPMFCNLRNVNFPKTTSSGKEVAIMCAYTESEWTPETAVTKGVGGSEEAVIHLSKRLAKRGYEVTVYNNCGHTEQEFDGVKYKPFWEFNYRDKMDTLILWRHPKLLDYDINAEKILLDLHDVISPGELNEKRVKKIDKIFVKSKFHQSLFPDVPKEKFVVVPNGLVVSDFDKQVERDPYLLVNTSSPDRSLSTLLRLFRKVKKEVPEAKLEWAYGWGVYEVVHRDNPLAMKMKDDLEKQMEEMDGVTNLGRISHGDVAEMYMRGNIFAYPTEFAEIDCISARKAQLAGCFPVTTDFSALNETVQHGVKLHSKKTKDNWCQPYQFDFAMNDKAMEKKWVEAVVKEMKNPTPRDEMMDWAKQFDWDKITDVWQKYL
jgi:tetratricopeptide (TPR) repeat protein